MVVFIGYSKIHRGFNTAEDVFVSALSGSLSDSPSYAFISNTTPSTSSVLLGVHSRTNIEDFSVCQNST